jgi:hypothetical protein
VGDFDWEEFLDLAEELVRRRGDVGAERTAVSRAYYAAFHRAGEHYARRGERLTLTGNDHALVWDWFVRPGADPRSLRIGNNGLWLRRARRRADYDPSSFPDLSRTAERAIALTRLLLVDLRALG